MAPSPRKHGSAFHQTWRETDAAFLDPTTLPITKVPRAWERRPEPSSSRDGKSRTVWRRYAQNSQPAHKQTSKDSGEDTEGMKSHTKRPVKKLRLPVESTDSESIVKKNQLATRWDRRKSGLPRKRRITRQFPDGLAGDDAVTETTRPTGIDAPHDTSSHSESEEQDIGIEHVSTSGMEKDDPQSLFPLRIEANNPATDAKKLGEPLNDLQDEAASKTTPPTDTLPLPSTISADPDVKDGSVVDAFTTSAQDAVQTGNFSIEDVVEEDTQLDSIESKAGIDQIPARESAEESDVEQITSVPALSEIALQGIAETHESREALLQSELDTQFHQPTSEETVACYGNESAQEADESFSLIISPVREYSPAFAIQSVTEEDRHAETASALQRSEENMETLHSSGEQGIPADITMQEPTEPSEVSISINSTATAPGTGLLNVQEDTSEQIEGIEDPHITSESMESQENTAVDDITNGLTLQLSTSNPSEISTRKVRSPTPPPAELGQDNLTYNLDDDTAILQNFINRAAASKAKKSASIIRRTSLQNRRDSGVVRDALKSPSSRKILEDKDPNSPSLPVDSTATMDLSQTLTMSSEDQLGSEEDEYRAEVDPSGDGAVEELKRPSSRRSTRTRSSRIPPPGSMQPQIPKSIPVRRADGGEPVVLRRTEAQELGMLTRANTRKNKSGAVAVNLRLIKLATEAALAARESTVENADADKERKGVRWDENLVHFQDGTTDAVASVVADVSSGGLEIVETSTDELAIAATTIKEKSQGKSKVEVKDKSASTPRVRRLRGLGAANGTPAKGLLASASSLLPDEVNEQQEKAYDAAQSHPMPSLPQPQRIPKPTKAKKIPAVSTTSSIAEPLAHLATGADIVPPNQEEMGAPAKERKSKLATPRKLKLPKPKTLSTTTSTAPSAPVALDGKENQSQNRGIAAATPKKGIPMVQQPAAAIPSATGAVESGLPRRRGQRRT